MKVVCINDKNLDHSPELQAILGPVEYGKVYTVLQETPIKSSWVIAERPVVNLKAPHLICGWKKQRFVELKYYQSEFKEAEPIQAEVV